MRGQYRKISPDDISMRDAGRFWQNVDTHDSTGCWPWTGSRNNRGRGTFKLSGWGTAVAPRIAYVLAYGKELLPNVEMREVTHTCDNAACCNPLHLLLDTHSGNMQGAVARDRKNMPKGTKHFHSKLTDEDVIHIFTLIMAGTPIPKISELFGVTQTNIFDIRARKAWKHVVPPEGYRYKRRTMREEQVHTVRRLIREGWCDEDIAKHEDVSTSSVRNIRTGAKWSRLPEQ